jgi:spore maturation protein CgeB
MNVVIIGNKGFDTLEYHLANSFCFLGHSVSIIDLHDVIPLRYIYNYLAIKYLKEYDDYLFKKIANRVIEASPDLVIGTYRFINPLCIKLIKKGLPHIPIIHINPDALTTFELQQIFVSPYDFYFTKDPYITNFMKQKMGLNAYYLPEAFNPRILKKTTMDRMALENRIDIDVLAFGYLYPYRVNMIKRLVEAGIKVTIYGKKDRRFFDSTLNPYFRNEWITGERKAELLYGSKIVFNNFHYAEIESVNCKFFEFAGSGAFQVCDYRTTVDEYSKIDSKKFTFNTIQEAIELINYYLDKPTERYEMATIQYNHFIQNHTYEHRVKQILETVF